MAGPWGWPPSEAALAEMQPRLDAAAEDALRDDPWEPPAGPVRFGGCFAAFARGHVGVGARGDPCWAAAVVWSASGAPAGPRRTDLHLAGHAQSGPARQADDVECQVVVAGRAGARYEPGLLALREGHALERAVRTLPTAPDVLLVDATGRDHPRGAGLALHLGAVLDVPTVGVTHRPLLASGDMPAQARGDVAPLRLGGSVVGYWLCTASNRRPLAVHAGWRTDPDTAVGLVMACSTEAARTPVPLQEARRVAREARHALPQPPQ